MNSNSNSNSNSNITNTKERLQKILASQGIASRRKSEEMIAGGRVSVNGVTATLGQSAVFGTDIITVDGKPLDSDSGPENVYIMLNKPPGYLTTVSDDRGRKTVMDLVTELPVRVYPVGRLDFDSEGLLLLTNDGDFANAVAHPSNNKNKTYEVEITGDVKKTAAALKRPMMLDGRAVTAVDVKVMSQSAGKGILRISIIEGRKRQIRKMCALCGVTVGALKRISVGDLKLGTLEPGKWRHLTNDEVMSLYRSSTQSLIRRG